VTDRHATTDTETMSTERDATPSYELDHASRSFGEGSTRVVALDAVTLTIERGEFVAVVGPSGSGKTTLLQLLGALDRPTGGSIRFEGQPLEHLGDRSLAELRLRALGFVFQQFYLLDGLSALENVANGLLYSGVPASERLHRAQVGLRRVGLGHRLDHHPSQLSGGEAQRVAVARAIIGQPTIVFADEPTGNLDSETSREVVELMKRLHAKKGLTFIVVTHDSAVGNQMQRVIVMRNGVILKSFRPTPA